MALFFLFGACSDKEQEETRFALGGEYLAASDFSEGLAAVKDANGYKFIDENGNAVFASQALGVGNFCEERAWFVKSDGSGGYYDKTGKEICSVAGMTVSTMRNFSGGLAVINVVQAYGVNCYVINKEGTRAAAFPEYVNTGEYGDFKCGLAKFRGEDNLYGYVNASGEKVVQNIFVKAGDFSENKALVESSAGAYCINASGEKLFDLSESYSEYAAFSDGALKVKENGKWFYLGGTGEKLFERGYDEAGDFYEGFAYVKADGKFSVINKSGETVFIAPDGTLSLGNCSEGYFAFSTQKGWGFLDASGNVAVSPAFDYAGSCSQGLAACRAGKNWGYVALSANK